ncbi:hypothetical protein P5673_027897 [Acropora cervicornis]|uniref:Uncharacterized protein n=1 Tax=Acropora cervicornis TaxID=6130 RepID=A0AAD9PY54_ACRCE|nr:hypothetical protein P5673_027897 [Acropora cervicornis]
MACSHTYVTIPNATGGVIIRGYWSGLIIATYLSMDTAARDSMEAMQNMEFNMPLILHQMSPKIQWFKPIAVKTRNRFYNLRNQNIAGCPYDADQEPLKSHRQKV